MFIFVTKSFEPDFKSIFVVSPSSITSPISGFGAGDLTVDMTVLELKNQKFTIGLGKSPTQGIILCNIYVQLFNRGTLWINTIQIVSKPTSMIGSVYVTFAVVQWTGRIVENTNSL